MSMGSTPAVHAKVKAVVQVMQVVMDGFWNTL